MKMAAAKIWKNMRGGAFGRSLKLKFIAGFIVISVILSSISLVTFYMLKSAMGKLDTMIQITIESNEIYNKAKESEPYLAEFLNLKKREDKQVIADNLLAMQRHLDYLETIVKHSESQNKLGSVRALTDNYASRVQSLISLNEAGNLSQAIVEQENIAKVTMFLKESIDEFIAVELSNDRIIKERMDQEAKMTGAVGMVLILMVACASVAGAAMFSNRVANVLARMARYAQDIAAGNLLTEKLEVKTRDDIDVLAQAFNQMTGTLREVIGKINATSGQVAGSAEILKTAIQQNSSAVEQIAVSIQQVSSGTTEQFQASEKSAAIIGQLYERNKIIAENAASVTDAAGKAMKAAGTGNEKMSVLLRQIGVIEEKIVAAKDITDHLQTRSQNIKKVLDAIGSLASQTNLLSLNASIEAARAGEYGRGFTVVADEIRKLANNTSEAAKEITVMLQDIQNQSKSIAGSMAAGVDEVREGMQMAQEAIDSFGNIVNTSENVHGQVNIIKQVIEDIAQDIYQVEEASKHIVKMAGESSRGSTEVAAAVEEQSASMQEILSSTAVVADMAEELKNCVLKFQI
ncbi:hypothetical protein P22_2611 [Propionispora sp. 2/2-37]|uniref:methyl-accepting chemotaxis protein n=1 Tax=Propionispora sp. 2/2-37 TaxID=1677858 RepID=UPI0006BB66FD|nr:methyl-accepting chemotaxis protein [Propionispora sp. 2/2-37]CUH96521.1 hypothetical protein P22_2611 [Propionispora sp. 2/2-37]